MEFFKKYKAAIIVTLVVIVGVGVWAWSRYKTYSLADVVKAPASDFLISVVQRSGGSDKTLGAEPVDISKVKPETLKAITEAIFAPAYKFTEEGTFDASKVLYVLHLYREGYPNSRFVYQIGSDDLIMVNTQADGKRKVFRTDDASMDRILKALEAIGNR